MTLTRRTLAASLFLLFTFAAHAATLNWTGAVNNLWSNPANWQQNAVPQSGDSLVFPSGAAVQAMQNDLAAGTILHSLTFAANSSYSVSGNIVQISGTVAGGTFHSGIRVMADNARVTAVIPGTLDANGRDFFLGDGGQVVELSGMLIGTGTIHTVAASYALTGSGTFSGTFVNEFWCRCGDRLLITGSYPNANFDIEQPIVGSGTIGELKTSGGIAGTHHTGNLTLHTSDDMDGTGALNAHIGIPLTPVVVVHGTVTLQNAPIFITWSYPLSAGSEYIVIENDGSDPVIGTLGYTNNGVQYQPYPEGSTVLQAGQKGYRITYAGGDGNDVALIAFVSTSVSIVSNSPDPSVYGQSVTIVAEVTAASGTPSGAVTLYATPVHGGPETTVGTAALDGNGRATFVTTSLNTSVYLRAVYHGQTGYASSTSPVVEHTVQRASTSITAVAPSSQAGQPAPVNVSVRAVAPGSGIPSGTATISKNGTTLGSGTLSGSGDAVVTISALPAGTHTLTAHYSGNSEFEPSETTFSYTATGTATPPSITASPALELEGNSGSAPAMVFVQLSAVSSEPVTVDYTTGGGNATAGNDYEPAFGTLVFSPGETSKTILIPIHGDDIPEPDEHFFVSFSNPHGAALSTDRVRVTIESDDPDYHATPALTYAEANGQPLTLDLYTPATGHGPFPLIVAINNEDWRVPGPATGTLLRQTARGYAVALLTFRSAPQNVFPAQIEDVKAAVRWLRANAARFHLDAARFGAIGIDSGAHLASLLGTTGDAAFLNPALGNPTVSSRVRSVIALYGPSDLLALSGDPAVCDGGTFPAVTQLLGCRADTCPDHARAASPVTYAGGGDDAAFLLMHGSLDCTVPFSQSEMFHNALHAARTDAELFRLQGAGHGGDAWSSRAVHEAMDEFLDRTLRAPLQSRRRSVSH